MPKVDAETPLYLACSSFNGGMEVIRSLLESGADVNKGNHAGRTPLYISSMKGYLEVVRVLLESGADVNKADALGWTALYVSSHQGHLEVVRLLLDRDAEVDKTNSCTNHFPLLASIQAGHEEVVRLLLERGAEVNKVNNYGETPLLVSCREGQELMIRLLLEKGAEVNKATNETPLQVSCLKGSIKVVRLLLCHGARGNGTSQQHLALVKLDIGPELKSWLAMCCGWNQLQHACEAREEGLVRELLEGAEDKRALAALLAPTGTLGWTALDCANAGKKQLSPLGLPVTASLVSLVKKASKRAGKELKMLVAEHNRKAKEDGRKAKEEELVREQLVKNKKAEKRARQKKEKAERRAREDEEQRQRACDEEERRREGQQEKKEKGTEKEKRGGKKRKQRKGKKKKKKDEATEPGGEKAITDTTAGEDEATVQEGVGLLATAPLAAVAAVAAATAVEPPKMNESIGGQQEKGKEGKDKEHGSPLVAAAAAKIGGEGEMERKLKEIMAMYEREKLEREKAEAEREKERAERKKVEQKWTEAEERRMCVICMERTVNLALGCGHQLCQSCSEQMEECPACRKRIESRIKLYDT